MGNLYDAVAKKLNVGGKLTFRKQSKPKASTSKKTKVKKQPSRGK